MTVLIGRKDLPTCRGCGCDDNHACETENGPCAWVLLDVAKPTGVCSACAERVNFHPLALVALGLESEEEQAEAILNFAQVVPSYREEALTLLRQAGAA